MREVGDRALAFIIKVQSAVQENTPIVVAGPKWTKKTVLQAVKYGACDILLTPPLPNELMEKIKQHMAPV
jgi:DNA-binding NtrC family response regulator